MGSDAVKYSETKETQTFSLWAATGTGISVCSTTEAKLGTITKHGSKEKLP